MKPSVPLLFLLAMPFFSNALAAEEKLDGKWRGSGGAALSISSGNTNNRTLNLTADAARATQHDKLSLYAQLLGSRSDSNGITSTSANQWAVGTRYDHNLSETLFGYGGLDLSRDQIKQISLRSEISGGLGYHLIKTSDNQWDVFGGLNYRTDQYTGAGVSINNTLRTKFDTVGAVLGEESNHKLTEATSVKQRLTINPDLGSSKGFRATFDAGLLTSLNKTLSLTVNMQVRHDSLAEAPIKKNDIMIFTGLNVKFD
jgi:putative salt-induced outer membrane protein YdiY